MAGRFSLEAIFKAIDKFSQPVAKMQAQTTRFTQVMGKGFDKLNGSVDQLAGTARKVGGAFVAASAVAGAALYNVIDTGAEFESTMVAAAAKFSPAIRQGTKEFAALQAAAEQVGAKTEFNAQQGAAALKDLASAGFGSRQAISALPGVVNLATAAEIDLATASEIASKSLGAFGLKTDNAAQLASNLTRVSDTLSLTADKTSASMGGLFESIKEGAPVAMTAGASLETYLALAGQLANAGIEGSEAGTTLKNVFLSLSAPTKEASGMLKKLGVSTVDAKGNMLDAIDILGQLEKATAKMGTADKAGALDAIFGKIPIAGLSSLLAVGSDGIRTLRTELEHAAGSTERMAATMRDKTKGDIDSFTSALESVSIAIFNVVKGPFRQVVQSMTKWIDANREIIAGKFQEFVQWIIDHLPEIVTWAKRIGIALGIFLAIAAAVKTVAVAIAVLVPAFKVLGALMSLPVLVTIAAIVGLIALWPKIKAFFVGIGNVSKSVWGFVQTTWQGLVSFFSPVFELLKTVAVAAFEFIAGIVAINVAIIKALWAPFGIFFGLLWKLVKFLTLGMFQYITGQAIIAYGMFMAVWTPIAEFFSGIWESIKAVFVSGFGAIAKFASETYDKFLEVWEPIGDFFSGLWQGIADTFNSVVGAILNKISSTIEAVRNLGREFLSGDEGGGEGDQPPAGPPPPPQVVPPADQNAAANSETKHTETTEITIKDQTGRAAVTKQPKRGPKPRLTRSGAH